MESAPFSIDDFGPLPVHRPESVAALGALVKGATEGGLGVYPVGGRTTLDVGLPPIKPGLAIDTTLLDQVIDYPARDMTVTVRAGITFARLQEILAREGQWLPVDVPHPERTTLGGAVALNLSGPRRFGQGTLRDYIIGISFVTDEGQEVKAGGRVVKNVAGYDLMKLQVGAVGTLGVVTQLTLKVKPRPEASAVVVLGCNSESLAAVLDRLHESHSRPVAVHLTTNTNGRPQAPWWLGLVFEEKKPTVDWQVATLLAEMRTAPVQDVKHLQDVNTAQFVQTFTNEAGGQLSGGVAPRFSFRANVRPSQTAAFCIAARGLQADLHLSVEALNGVVTGHVVHDLTAEAASAILNKLSDLATAGGGNVTVRRCPTAWKKSLPVWGRPSGDRELMRHVKRTLDPKNVFNPGRLFGDL